MNKLHFINSVLNIIFPNVCGICNCLCKEDLCKKCEIKLNKIAKIRVDKYKKFYFRKHLFIFKYEGIIRQKLLEYKFYEKTYIYKSFVNFILKNKKICDFLKNYDIIIPVPIHNKRKRERGYNQSEVIAKQIANSFENLICVTDVLYKKKYTKPQNLKTKEERKKNVIGVYEIKNKEKIINKKILVLDDIYTTGSTLNECCKALRQANIKFVDVITIAKD